MKKSLFVLVVLLLCSPMIPAKVAAENRGSLTISATFGNLAVYTPVVRHSPPPTVIVVNEPRPDGHWKRHHRPDRHHHDCDFRQVSRQYRYQEPTVVYYEPDYRAPRGYRY